MNTTEIIKSLCEKKGITLARLERDLNFGNGTIAKAGSNMRCDRLKQIADYFGVSMEYLMTGVEPSPAAGPVFSPEDQKLISAFHQASEGVRESICKLLDIDVDSAVKKGTA